ncbi:MAG TPA: NAD(P)/FAD-dependent oxidoreductase [Steroidobacteraceae bacterium]|jgi:kynurenine 3-monooxygenase|nr:NAD(P)/FAD-dependent oxidoreductase [Steroidobacteraceae bacterium]
MPQPRLNIAGAGLAGALLAVLLARRGFSVNLFERRADPRRHPAEAGRSINLALAARGIHALEQAGLMQQVRALLLPMRGRMIHEPHSDTPPHLQPYGQRDSEVIYSVGRAALNRVLIEAAAALPQVTLSFDTTCTAVDARSGTLHTLDNRSGAPATHHGITFATDGAGSALRTDLARAGVITVSEQPLAHGYKELHIPACAGTYALEPEALHVWPRHGFMLIALPNPDHSFTATLFLPHTGPSSFEALRSAAAVQEFFAREFPGAARLIPDLAAQFRDHPLGSLGTIHAAPWACGPVLLMGDAAHAIVPFHGQGMNAAFEDCSVLDAMLESEASQPDWPALLRRFDAGRRQDAEAIARMALENYAEMRSAVLDERYLRHKGWALQLERLHPQRFIPRYAMVMFHPQIPYSQALRRGAVQQQILELLEARRQQSAGGAELDAAELGYAAQLIAERL